MNLLVLLQRKWWMETIYIETTEYLLHNFVTKPGRQILLSITNAHVLEGHAIGYCEAGVTFAGLHVRNLSGFRKTIHQETQQGISKHCR